MNRNIEIKARIVDWNATLNIIRKLADTGPKILVQEDVFFNTATGRLKLRTINDATSELIYYHRPDAGGPKGCNYLRVDVVDPAGMRELLRAVSQERGVVRKHRTLYLVKNTRIHLDQVEGLGNFLELEVVLSPEQSDTAGVETANHLIALLGILPSSLIECAYIDLLDQENSGQKLQPELFTAEDAEVRKGQCK